MTVLQGLILTMAAATAWAAWLLISPAPRARTPSTWALLLIALVAATMFALYGLLTRFAARKDTAATSFFWTGTAGAVVMTFVGIWFWEPMTGPDWAWMATLCVTGALGHWLLIKTYEAAEASAVQPFAYLQLVFASVIGISVFGETLRPNVALGTAIIVAAGLFTLWRARQKG